MNRVVPVLALAAAAAFGQSRQTVEGTIALKRFGPRIETAGAFLVHEGTELAPLRVPAGKVLTIRQVTATCTLHGLPECIWMNFWTIRSSHETTVHHYLPMTTASRGYTASWVAEERVQIPVRAGGRPVATFQKPSASAFSNDACVGSWSGVLEDAAAN
ncbi:MAG: hypothetical protein FJW31_29250 [Acidobacteria bacterium]|nr:hypothetical protein [Acidobacteriota bacterium]